MNMCNALEELRREGVLEGRLEGIRATIRTCKKFSISEEDIIRNIMEEFSLLLLISQFVTNQICSHVTDLPSFVSLAFLYNPADFLPDYLFHLQCYV